MTKPIRSPHDTTLSGLSTMTLLVQWQDARTRALVAKHTPSMGVDVEDLFTELVLGQRLATEVTCGRWCVVADLLKANGLDSWVQVGTALDISETDARDGFHAWITGQVDLWHRSGAIGITEAEAVTLFTLSEGITW